MTGPHFIIEGPDGAGKTALSCQICNHFSMAYHHEGPPPAELTELGAYYTNRLLEAKEPTVFDRLHLGELIYGPLLRGGHRLSPGGQQFVNSAIVATGSTVVICLPPWPTCLVNNRSKEELIKDEVLLKLAYDGWAHLAEETAAIIFDYTKGDFSCFI
jgi:hypothetical protein